MVWARAVGGLLVLAVVLGVTLLAPPRITRALPATAAVALGLHVGQRRWAAPGPDSTRTRCPQRVRSGRYRT